MTFELITPVRGPGVCPGCFNFTLAASGRCRACAASESHLSAMVAISYAAAGGALHHALADYKRAAEPAVPYLSAEIAGLLSRFLTEHERCVARAAGVEGFHSVAVVPSTHGHGEVAHPLRQIVAQHVGETSGRHCDALVASGEPCTPHSFDRRRFVPTRRMDGQDVLLVDDVWTTGATAQSAAAVIRHAGARTVAIVVIGRYVNGYWGGIADRLAGLERRTRSGTCALCAAAAGPHPREAGSRRLPPGARSGKNQTEAHSVGSRLMDT
jgi:predicted amidophosphoribosyltransferase